MALIDGDDGDNDLVGTADADTINGLGGNDTIEGLAGADQLFGGLGLDTLSYASSAVGVGVGLGPTGNIIFPANGDAAGDSGDGFENLRGSAQADLFSGNAHDNVIEGGAGADELYGGNESGQSDTLSYSHSAEGVFVALLDGRLDVASGGDAEGDFAEGFENITGSAFNDTLIGDASANILSGAGGDDDLHGGGGGDQMFGGTGSDVLYGDADAETLDGGSGDDDLAYNESAGGVSVTLGKKGHETIGLGGDAAGDHILNIESIDGSDFVDLLKGNEKNNTLVGWGGDDTVKGRGGHDFVGGADGDDKVSGGGGDDQLFGGAGLDRLKGGSGKDWFYFTETPGPANLGTVVDFVVKDDGINLRGSVFTNTGPGYLDGDAFVKGTHAHDAEDRIIYDKHTGALYFDADGTGAVDQADFALLDKGLKLTHNDFFVE